MNIQSFTEFLRESYPSPKSSAFYSYLKALKIIDEIFKQRDTFRLNNKPLIEIRDPYLMTLIKDYIIDEEEKFRNNQKSFFDSVNRNQTSYPNRRFCSAAIKKLAEYVDIICQHEVSNLGIFS